MSLASKSEPAFVSIGFKNWKKAKERFICHEKSSTHHHAISQLQQVKTGSVLGHMSKQLQKQQRDAKLALSALFSSCRYLAGQGLALRGHDDESGNFYSLLKLRSSDMPALDSWLQRTTNFVSPDCQNEMLGMLTNAVLKKIVSVINSESRQFAVIVDGTQDCTGVEQESVCIRYVDKDLQPKEVFVGLYAPPDTCGRTIATVIEDALLRLQLPIKKLRAQTYDGASNMSGAINGCQALISQKCPLALWFHCGAHCANLAAQSVAAACPAVRDAIALANELGVLYNRSMTYRNIFNNIASMSEEHYTTLKPLCPTRWLCRTPGFKAVLDQYEAVVESLRDMAHSKVSETAVKANGLLDKFQKGNTYLLLQMALKLFNILENLNRSLQCRSALSATLTGMLEAVKIVRSELQEMRNVSSFKSIFNDAVTAAAQLNLDSIELPRQHKPPKRYCGPANAHAASTAEDYYCVIFFSFLTWLAHSYQSDSIKTRLALVPTCSWRQCC